MHKKKAKHHVLSNHLNLIPVNQKFKFFSPRVENWCRFEINSFLDQKNFHPTFVLSEMIIKLSKHEKLSIHATNSSKILENYYQAKPPL